MKQKSSMVGFSSWKRFGTTGLASSLLVLFTASTFAQFSDTSLATREVNESIEPKLSKEDRPLYEKVAPLLRTNPAEAITAVQTGMTPESSPAFYLLLGNRAQPAPSTSTRTRS